MSSTRCLLLAVLTLSGCEADNPGADASIEDLGVATDRGPSEDDGGPADLGVADGGEPTGCTSDLDCEAPTPACRIPAGMDSGACVPCTDSTHCPAETPVCGPGNQCFAEEAGVCREDFDCPVEAPLCLEPEGADGGVCVTCIEQRHCGAGEVCSTTGDCVPTGEDTACVTDEDCAPVRTCVGGECVF